MVTGHLIHLTTLDHLRHLEPPLDRHLTGILGEWSTFIDLTTSLSTEQFNRTETPAMWLSRGTL